VADKFIRFLKMLDQLQIFPFIIECVFILLLHGHFELTSQHI